MKIKGLLLICIPLIIVSCGLKKKTTFQNLSFLYNSDLCEKSPQYWVFHNADTLTTIYFSLKSSNLLYTKFDSTDNIIARFNISIEIYENFQSKISLHTFDSIYCDTNNGNIQKTITSAFQLSLKKDEYIAKIIYHNPIEKDSITSYLWINKKNANNAQNFLVLNADSTLFNNNIVTSKKQLMLFYNDTTASRLFVNCYNSEFPIASTPFTISNENPIELKTDTSFFIDIKKGYSSILTLTKRGIYFIRKDALTDKGIALLNFGDDFPHISTATQLIYPLKYISSKKEYNEMLISKDKKLAVDAFWLKIAENDENAKLLIKKYYNLVIEANRFFTSYHEGWKTDRGIVYIVFGPPNIVYKTNRSETWIYGAANSRFSTKFYFYKVENQFTNNDFSLNKSESYRDSWYLALSKWRKI